jgi:hypothetical protein
MLSINITGELHDKADFDKNIIEDNKDENTPES